MDYSRRFHVKRRGNPRYGYIARSLMAASDTDDVPRATFMDLGSSIGCLLKEIAVITGFPKANLHGIDHSKVVMEEYEHAYSFFHDHDLTTGPCTILRGGIDTVICQEVAEHIPERFEESIISSIGINISPAGLLLWRAATPGQKGKGHVNLKPLSYWESAMLDIGLRVDHERTGVYRDTMDSMVIPEHTTGMIIYRDSVIFSRTETV